MLAGHAVREIFGGDIERATPDPFPNSEVKPLGADGTARVAVWESRSLPGNSSESLPGDIQGGFRFLSQRWSGPAPARFAPLTGSLATEPGPSTRAAPSRRGAAEALPEMSPQRVTHLPGNPGCLRRGGDLPADQLGLFSVGDEGLRGQLGLSPGGEGSPSHELRLSCTGARRSSLQPRLP